MNSCDDARAGAHPPLLDRALQRPDHRRPDGDDAPSLAPRAVHRLGGLVRNLVALGVHAVGGLVVAAHREERPGPDVEGDEAPLHSAGLELGERLGREVEPRGGRGHRAVRPSVHGLVPDAILRRGLTRDVGRKRHPAGLLEQRGDRALGLEADAELALAERLHAPSPRPPSSSTTVPARSPLLAWPRQTQITASAGPSRARGGLDASLGPHQQQLHPSAAPLLPPEEAGGDDARVVEHHHVARAEQPRPVAEHPVRDGPGRAVEDQQARRVPPLQRLPGDERVGKVEVVVGESQTKPAWGSGAEALGGSRGPAARAGRQNGRETASARPRCSTPPTLPATPQPALDPRMSRSLRPNRPNTRNSKLTRLWL